MTTGNDVYEIRVRAQLDDHWQGWFAGLVLTSLENGDTLISGPVQDQAELHGILAKIRDLGLPLLSVSCREPTCDRTATQRGDRYANRNSNSNQGKPPENEGGHG